jgi:PAS domain S-box-containing protein
MQTTKSESQLLTENEELRSRLAETEATLEAIRNGEVDAIVVSGMGGEKIFTLTSAETPYRIIIEEMEEGAVTVSEEGIILFCNRRFAQLVNSTMEQVVGKYFEEFVAECDRAKFENLMSEGLTGRIKEEITTLDKAGEPVYLHLSMCILPHGMLGSICIIVTDITELKKHQQNLQVLVKERTIDLNKANTELREINATKDKLFSIIAHDLRGPFTSLLGFSDLLIDNIGTYDTERFQQLLYHINSAAKSAYTLLENLLIWARSQNKQLLFKPEDIKISLVVKEVMQNLNSLATIKNIKLKNSINDEVLGFADENMLTAIIRNLISNAIKFCNSGGTVELSAVYEPECLVISVTDNGIGMKEEIKNNLFRADSNTSLTGTAQEKGTGLGLLICREFVEKHNGKIWVESQPGKGSTFAFTLPHNL